MRGRTLASIGCWFAFAVAIAGQESVATSSQPPPVVQSGWTQSNSPLATRSFRRARKRKKRRQKEKHKGNHQKHKGNHPKQHGNSVEHKKTLIIPRLRQVHPRAIPTELSKTEAETPEKEANLPNGWRAKSPLRSLGVPAPAVPVVCATAVSVSLFGAVAIFGKAGNSVLEPWETILRQVISTHLRVLGQARQKAR